MKRVNVEAIILFLCIILYCNLPNFINWVPLIILSFIFGMWHHRLIGVKE
jgi:hypothetical protein